MIVDFEKNDHIYSVNGNIAETSVTELLQKQGLAPDYSSVSKKVLNAKAKRGTEIHKDLEGVLNEKDYTPKTQEGEQFAEWVKNNLDSGVGELKIGYDQNGLTIAGTADFVAIGKHKELIIGDHKTTAKFEREYVTWQVNLYDYFLRVLGDEPLNEHILNWKGASKFYCLWYNKGEFQAIELEKVPDEEIRRLLDCEAKGTKYERKELVVDKDLQLQFKKAEEYLMQVENTYKQAQENAKKIREQMLSLFEKQGIYSWKTDNMSVTYVISKDKETLDSKRLKKEEPTLYSRYVKLTKVKPFLRVTIKKEGEEE